MAVEFPTKMTPSLNSLDCTTCLQIFLNHVHTSSPKLPTIKFTLKCISIGNLFINNLKNEDGYMI